LRRFLLCGTPGNRSPVARLARRVRPKRPQSVRWRRLGRLEADLTRHGKTRRCDATTRDDAVIPTQQGRAGVP
jgi:hypothetical protein